MRFTILSIFLSILSLPAWSATISFEDVYAGLTTQKISPVTINGIPVFWNGASAVCRLAGYKVVISSEVKLMSASSFYASNVHVDSSLILTTGAGNRQFLSAVVCAR